MNETIERGEHEEFVKRIEENNRRIDKRLSLLENKMEQNNQLLVSISELASNMKDIKLELADQGQRLKAIEDRDGKKWRSAVGYVCSGLVGILVAVIAQFIINLF